MPDRMGWREKKRLRDQRKRNQPSTGGNDPPPEDRRWLTWRLARIDLDGDWSWIRLIPEHHHQLRAIFAEYEGTPLHVLRQNERIRNIPVRELNPEARARLEAIQQDDLDELWELRLGVGDWRIWGILDRSRFDVLWWDPDHTVCRGQDRQR
jgi:hypothetical protein